MLKCPQIPLQLINTRACNEGPDLLMLLQPLLDLDVAMPSEYEPQVLIMNKIRATAVAIV